MRVREREREKELKYHIKWQNQIEIVNCSSEWAAKLRMPQRNVDKVNIYFRIDFVSLFSRLLDSKFVNNRCILIDINATNMKRWNFIYFGDNFCKWLHFFSSSSVDVTHCFGDAIMFRVCCRNTSFSFKLPSNSIRKCTCSSSDSQSHIHIIKNIAQLFQ